MKDMKKLTLAGKLVWVAQTHELGMDLLKEVKRHKHQLQIVEVERQQKRGVYKSISRDYIDLRAKKVNDEKVWEVDDYKVVIKVLKDESDWKTPLRKGDLVNMWKKIRHCDEEVTKEYEKLAWELMIMDGMM